MYKKISIQQLKQLIIPDFESGKLLWSDRNENTSSRHKSFNTRFANKPALDCYDGKYLSGSIYNKKYRAHIVIYALYHGRWPDKQIDHINQDKLDNRVSNLREVDRADNQRNMSINTLNKFNESNISITYNSKYRVRFGKKHIKTLDTLEEAVEVRDKYKEVLGYSQSHGSTKVRKEDV